MGPVKVKDLPGTVRQGHTRPGGFVELNGFALYLSKNQEGLYRTDGTAEGTRVVRDLEPRLDALTAPRMAVLRERAYWRVSGTRPELWTSDGTPEGTGRVELPTFYGLSAPVSYGGYLYFSNSFDLYRSDGTAEGTERLASNMMLDVTEHATTWVMGGRLFLPCAVVGGGGTELCVTDGTAGGFQVISETRPDSLVGYRPLVLGELDGKLLFTGIPQGTTRRFYATDGTRAGTTLLHPTLTSTTEEGPDFSPGLAVLKGVAYLPCHTPETGSELCRTDGTPEGTGVLDLSPGTASSSPGWPVVLGSRLVFKACGAQTGCEPWASDGTVAGSAPLSDVFSGRATACCIRGSCRWAAPCCSPAGPPLVPRDCGRRTARRRAPSRCPPRPVPGTWARPVGSATGSCSRGTMTRMARRPGGPTAPRTARCSSRTPRPTAGWGAPPSSSRSRTSSS
ncbi:hypothetical protein ACLESD_01270 [Pyxidicoccus sp. 3LFB2]